MATRLVVSPQEYFGMTFEGPDSELLDGEIRKRALPNYPHARVQALLAHRFLNVTATPRLYPCVEIRLRVTATRYRVADMAVFAEQEPTEAVPSSPPVVVAEIISPEDRYTDVLQKLEEYRSWGVRHVWLVDPVAGKLYLCGSGGLSEVSQFSIPEWNMTIRATEILG